MSLLLLTGCPNFGDLTVGFVDTAGAPAFPCPGKDTVAELEAHVRALTELSTVLEAERDEAPVFLDLPGAHYGTWFRTSTDCQTSQEVCAGGLCWLVDCGESWTVHTRPDPKESFQLWTGTFLQDATFVDDGVDLYFTADQVITPGGTTFSGYGNARLDGGLWVDWLFWDAGSAFGMEVTNGEGGITWDGELVAPWDEDAFDQGSCFR